MHKTRNTLLLFAVFALVTAAGSLQGRDLQQIREAERFYRWLHSMASDVFLQQEGGEDRAAARRLDLDDAASGLAAMALGGIGAAQAAPIGTNAFGTVASLAAVGPAVEASELVDYRLLRRIVAKTEPVLGGDATRFRDARLVQMLNDGGHENQIWDLATGSLLAEERALFIDHQRRGRLTFAQDIDIAEAQSSGVNLFNLFFGFRKLAANFVWLQVDKYWHMGLQHRMLPLMKTTVTLDPNFVDAYLVGAWHLGYNITARMPETPPEQRYWLPERNALVGEREEYYYMAVDYLEDGIRHNPREYKLHFDLGYAIYREKLNDYENAVKHLERAVSLPHERWVPRQLFICYELNGQYERAQRGWEQYLERFPENVVAPRFIQRNKGLRLEERADYHQRLAQRVEDPREAHDYREQATALYEEAKEVFRGIDDAYARARVALIDAKLLEQDGRNVEAIALLEYARLESGFIFTEASDMIIEYKQDAGIPLSLSEQMEIERRRDLARARARARAAAAEMGTGE